MKKLNKNNQGYRKWFQRKQFEETERFDPLITREENLYLSLGECVLRVA